MRARLSSLLGFNQRLSFTEEQMVTNQEMRTQLRTKLRDGAVRQQVSSKLKKFGELLISDYKFAPLAD
jgi:hypothetical protein